MKLYIPLTLNELFIFAVAFNTLINLRPNTFFKAFLPLLNYFYGKIGVVRMLLCNHYLNKTF